MFCGNEAQRTQLPLLSVSATRISQSPWTVAECAVCTENVVLRMTDDG